MVDPTFDIIGHRKGRPTIVERTILWLGSWRRNGRHSENLPEPCPAWLRNSIGSQRSMPYEFYQQLVSTGTLHIVAASGFNVMIVASVLMQVLSKLLAKGGR